MEVIKRNGDVEEVSFDKIKNRIRKLTNGFTQENIPNPLPSLHVDPIIITQKVIGRLYNRVKTAEIDELSAQICISMMTENLEYGDLASRIIISNNHKNTSSIFSEKMQQLYDNRVNGEHSPLLSEDFNQFVQDNSAVINNAIDYQRDYLFDYFGFKTLEKSYLMKIKGQVIERIQDLFMRVSCALHTDNLASALQSYNLISKKYFIHATPTLYHAGIPRAQLLSCFLLGIEDSVSGIFKNLADVGQISKWAGGIGIHMSNIRCKNSLIRGTNGRANGIIPMLKLYNDTSKFINQSGKRPGSIAIYMEPHHPEIIEFLQLRKNHGVEDERARDLFLAVWLSDLFMRRVDSDEMWSLFDPDECPGLNDVYGEEYERLYHQYEREGRAKKQIKTRIVWKAIMDSQIETGTPYVLFKDNINRKNNQSNVGIIRSSNLCAEIVEYSDASEYACCVLASIALPAFVRDNHSIDYDKLEEVVSTIVRNLNKVIDLNYYPVPETERSNKRHRPLGIGVQGLADLFIKMGVAFDSEEARVINRDLFESIYYYAVKESVALAKTSGSYSTFAGSPISCGQFQFDLWGVQPSSRHDWSNLRREIQETGIRNSLLVALMPTASTSQILGNNECIEPYTSNIYSRRTIAGDFIIVNKYLVKDLQRRGLWSLEMKNRIIANNGSIANIEEIPQSLKDLYKTVWEMKQKSIIQLSIDRGPFVCQTQSLNLFFEEPDYNKLTGALFYGWRNGLKTGSYYIRSRPRVQAQQFTIDPSLVKKKEQISSSDRDHQQVESNDENKVMICTLDNRESCEMCSS
jgi:ribonucleoside-diphosphate reductase alpha subunit